MLARLLSISLASLGLNQSGVQIMAICTPTSATQQLSSILLSKNGLWEHTDDPKRKVFQDSNDVCTYTQCLDAYSTDSGS